MDKYKLSSQDSNEEATQVVDVREGIVEDIDNRILNNAPFSLFFNIKTTIRKLNDLLYTSFLIYPCLQTYGFLLVN
jgi:predicted nucleotidyltransferase